MELEELEEEEEMSGEHGQADWMMEQVIKIMREVFETSRHVKPLPELHNLMTSYLQPQRPMGQPYLLLLAAPDPVLLQ